MKTHAQNPCYERTNPSPNVTVDAWMIILTEAIEKNSPVDLYQALHLHREKYTCLQTQREESISQPFKEAAHFQLACCFWSTHDAEAEIPKPDCSPRSFKSIKWAEVHLMRLQ